MFHQEILKKLRPRKVDRRLIKKIQTNWRELFKCKERWIKIQIYESEIKDAH